MLNEPQKGLPDAWRAITLCICYDLIVAMISMRIGFAGYDALTRQTQTSSPTNLLSFELMLALASALLLTGVYRQVWRHTNASDLRRIVQAALLANLIILPMAYFAHDIEDIPIGVFLLEIPVLVTLMVGGRLVSRSRATGQWLSAFRKARSDRPFAIIVGEGAKVADTIATLSQTPDGLPVRPLGIIETGGAFTGRAIGGVQVLGSLNMLDHFISVMSLRYGSTPWIALAGRLSRRADMDMVLDVSSRHGATIQRLRRNAEAGVAPARPNDLLSRTERKLDERLVSEMVSGARIFVTGAGGTIGSELVRQCAALGPSEITLFDAGEYNLYEIDMYLRGAYPNMGRRTFLGNIRDRSRLDEAMEIAKPDVVIHAAALKHVPLMEMNPNEAILTNVDGARNVALAAAEARVDAFVFISTDKAVNPANVMGATKRAAELYLQALAPKYPKTRFAMVRFGNVLGSAGSVAPLFERQIAAGGPVTVTHKDMTRYFMSVEEAASLVIQAAALTSREDHREASRFVLDMGDPVSILELARRMIRLNGLRPDEDIRIIYTGLRPGEKLNERVFYKNEDVEQTEIDGILRANTRALDLEVLHKDIDRLVSAAQSSERDITLRLLSQLAPELSNCTGHDKRADETEPLAADNKAANVTDLRSVIARRRDGQIV